MLLLFLLMLGGGGRDVTVVFVNVGGVEMLLLFCYCYELLAPQPPLSSSTHACARSFVHPASRGRPRTQFHAPPP